MSPPLNIPPVPSCLPAFDKENNRPMKDSITDGTTSNNNHFRKKVLDQNRTLAAGRSEFRTITKPSLLSSLNSNKISTSFGSSNLKVSGRRRELQGLAKNSDSSTGVFQAENENFKSNVTTKLSSKKIQSSRRVLRFGETLESLFCLTESSANEERRALCHEIACGDKAEDAKAWLQVLQWASESVTTNDSCSTVSGGDLLRLHRRATAKISNVGDDKTHLAIFLSYAKAQALFGEKIDARRTYRHIQNKRIGERDPDLYIAMAKFEQDAGNETAAINHLDVGIKKEAQPIKHLQEFLAKLKGSKSNDDACPTLSSSSQIHNPKCVIPSLSTANTFSGKAVAREKTSVAITSDASSTSPNDDRSNQKGAGKDTCATASRMRVAHFQSSASVVNSKSFSSSLLSSSRLRRTTNLGGGATRQRFLQSEEICKLDSISPRENANVDIYEGNAKDVPRTSSHGSSPPTDQQHSSLKVLDSEDVTEEIPGKKVDADQITAKGSTLAQNSSVGTYLKYSTNRSPSSPAVSCCSSSDDDDDSVVVFNKNAKRLSEEHNTDDLTENATIAMEDVEYNHIQQKTYPQDDSNKKLETVEKQKELDDQFVRNPKTPAKKVVFFASKAPSVLAKTPSSLPPSSLSSMKKTPLQRKRLRGGALRINPEAQDSLPSSPMSNDSSIIDAGSKKLTRTDLNYMLNWNPSVTRKSTGDADTNPNASSDKPEKPLGAMDKIEEGTNEMTNCSTSTNSNDRSIDTYNRNDGSSAEDYRSQNQRRTPSPISNASDTSATPSHRLSSSSFTSTSPMVHMFADSDPDFLPLVRKDNILRVNNVPFVKLGVIGKGASCKVYRALSKDCAVVAVKKVKLDGKDKKTIDGYANEIALLKRLRGNPAIIQMYDSEVDLSRKAIFLVMEVGEVDLNYVLQQQASVVEQDSNTSKRSSLNMNFIRLTWQQMLGAVHCIHEERIVHGDLKPANFLFVRGALKLIDFGIAKAISSDDTTNIYRDSQIGTLNYMSPEAILDTGTGKGGARIKLGRASDIWSLGCILYQMVYGKTPFAELHMIPKLQAICNPSHQIRYPNTGDEAARDTIKLCLRRTPGERPPIVGEDGLLNHFFLHSKGR